jgi:hypothetical protein
MSTAETTSTSPVATGDTTPLLRIGSVLMAIGGIAFVGYAVVFFVRNFTGSFLELGIGPHEVSVSRTEIEAFNPSLVEYVSHLHIALSGFIAATGIAVAALSWYGVRRGLLWAWVTAVAALVIALAVALPAHYPNHFDTLWHLGPVYLATGIFVVGALLALPGVLGGRASRTGGGQPTRLTDSATSADS